MKRTADVTTGTAPTPMHAQPNAILTELHRQSDARAADVRQATAMVHHAVQLAACVHRDGVRYFDGVAATFDVIAADVNRYLDRRALEVRRSQSGAMLAVVGDRRSVLVTPDIEREDSAPGCYVTLANDRARYTHPYDLCVDEDGELRMRVGNALLTAEGLANHVAAEWLAGLNLA